jgi:hypothetical protein
MISIVKQPAISVQLCSDVFSVQVIFLAFQLAKANVESSRVRFCRREDPRFSVSRKRLGSPAKVGSRWRGAGQSFAEVIRRICA